ncbi:MAG: hypothetical protein K8S21_03830 [Gemmatimonadetes bacterium]|nr:hypothetical protein [Gemmatimonadota bacterium]
MSHLSIDRLAAIADDTPTADEATHIAGCWDCRAEVAAFRRLARMSAMAPIPMEPLTAWSTLAPQLRAEGIIVDAQRLERQGGQGVVRGSAHPAATFAGGAPVVPLPDRRPRTQVWMMRAAAGLALVVGGAFVGRVTAGVPVGTGSFGNVPVEGRPLAAAPAFRSANDAMQVLTSAQQQYQDAAAFLASQDTSSRFVGMNQDLYQTRLDALDEIAAATRSALYRAPQDPMLNQYYLTTLGAREATLRQIGATMPATRRLERY